MNTTQHPLGTTPEIRPFHPESTIIQRSITMLGIVIGQLRTTLIDLEGLRHE